MSDVFAHSVQGLPTNQWHLLEDHLKGTAELARKFAGEFGCGEWGYLAGLWHDLGKGTAAWQAYLRKANEIVDEFSEFYDGHPVHSAAGAQWMHSKSREAGKLLAYCIAGHHGGLPNWTGDNHGASLKTKIDETAPEVNVPFAIPEFPKNLPINMDKERFGFQLQFFVRMLFSCLVDADFLDTERFLDREKSGWRSAYPDIAELHERFWKEFNALRERADHSLNVNKQR